MFIIKQSPTFTWPVSVELADTGGKVAEHTFDAEFKRLGRAELRPLYEKLTDEGGPEAVVRAVLVGWSGIKDGDSEVPFSESALAQVLDIPKVCGAILNAYTTAVGGEAARRN